MFLKEVYINDFKVLKDMHISLEENKKSNVFSVASLNGAGKSTLLQFVFILLHASFDESRKQYVKNMLEGLYDLKPKDELIELAKFKIENNKKEIEIEFFLSPNVTTEVDFTCLLDISEIKNKVKNKVENKFNLESKLESLENIKSEIEKTKRISIGVSRKISSYVEDSIDESVLYDRADNYEDYYLLLDRIIYKTKIELDQYNDLIKLLKEMEKENDKLNNYLREKKLSYSLHLDNETVLLFHTNIDKEQLDEISKKIFLVAPSSQVFLFLELEGRKELFKEYYIEYYEYINDAKLNLNGFFNYDFVSTELIIEAFKNAMAKDSEVMIETGQYGNNFKETQQELNNFLPDKNICTDANLSEAFFKLKISNKRLLPEDLSHGELKRLGLYIWLKNNVSQNSLILMDEVDIGLHPNWQYALHDDLQKWSKDSQFILATHSPQIISNTHYKNLIILTKEEEKLAVKRYTKSPLDRDINTIIKTIMGADYIPRELQELQNKYRNLFDNGKEETDAGKKLKEELLEYESEGSAFFQAIVFEKEFRA